MTDGEGVAGEYAVAGRFATRVHADLVRLLLAEHGIEAQVLSDDCGGVDPALQFANSARLVVRHADLVEAKELIREREMAEPDSTETND